MTAWCPGQRQMSCPCLWSSAKVSFKPPTSTSVFFSSLTCLALSKCQAGRASSRRRLFFNFGHTFPCTLSQALSKERWVHFVDVVVLHRRSAWWSLYGRTVRGRGSAASERTHRVPVPFEYGESWCDAPANVLGSCRSP